MRRWRIAALLVLVSFGLAACNHLPILTFEDVVGTLRRSGFEVRVDGDPAYDRHFETRRLPLTVNGVTVMVYSYPKRPTVSIEENGRRVDGKHLEWVATPWVFQYSNVVVVVLTDDPAKWSVIRCGLENLTPRKCVTVP